MREKKKKRSNGDERIKEATERMREKKKSRGERKN